jgi:hypothetical protein
MSWDEEKQFDRLNAHNAAAVVANNICKAAAAGST